MENLDEKMDDVLQEVQMLEPQDETRLALESTSNHASDQAHPEKGSDTKESTLPSNPENFAGDVEITTNLDPNLPVDMNLMKESPYSGRNESKTDTKCLSHLESSAEEIEFESSKREDVLSKQPKSSVESIETELPSKLKIVPDESKKKCLDEQSLEKENFEIESDERSSLMTPKQLPESGYTKSETDSDCHFIVPLMKVTPKSNPNRKSEPMDEQYVTTESTGVCEYESKIDKFIEECRYKASSINMDSPESLSTMRELEPVSVTDGKYKFEEKVSEGSSERELNTKVTADETLLKRLFEVKGSNEVSMPQSQSEQNSCNDESLHESQLKKSFQEETLVCERHSEQERLEVGAVLESHSESERSGEEIVAASLYNPKSLEDEELPVSQYETEIIGDVELPDYESETESTQYKALLNRDSETESSDEESVTDCYSEGDEESETESSDEDSVAEGYSERDSSDGDSDSVRQSEAESSDKGSVLEFRPEQGNSEDETLPLCQSETESSDGETMLEPHSEPECTVEEAVLESHSKPKNLEDCLDRVHQPVPEGHESAPEGLENCLVPVHQSEPESQQESLLVCLSELENVEESVPVCQSKTENLQKSVQKQLSEPESFEEVPERHSERESSYKELVLVHPSKPVVKEERKSQESQSETINEERELNKELALKPQTEFSFTVKKEQEMVGQSHLIKNEYIKTFNNPLDLVNTGRLINFPLEIENTTAEKTDISSGQKLEEEIQFYKDCIIVSEVETLSEKELSVEDSNLPAEQDSTEKIDEYVCQIRKKRSSEEAEYELKFGRKRTVEAFKFDYPAQPEGTFKGIETKNPTEAESKRFAGENTVPKKLDISPEKANAEGSKESLPVMACISKTSMQVQVPEDFSDDKLQQQSPILKDEAKCLLSAEERIVEQAESKLPFKKRLSGKVSRFSSKRENLHSKDSALYTPLDKNFKETISYIVSDIDFTSVEQQANTTSVSPKQSQERELSIKPAECESSKVVFPSLEHIASSNLVEAKRSLRELGSFQFSMAEVTNVKTSTESEGSQIEEFSPIPGPSYIRNSSPKNESSEEELKISKCYELKSSIGVAKSLDSTNGTLPLPFHLMSDPSYITEVVAKDEENGFVHISYDQKIRDGDIIELLNRMRINHYAATKSEEDSIYSKCKGLYEKDYICEVVDNSGGALSVNYPIRLLVPVKGKWSEEETSGPFDPAEYETQVKSCHTSRCRTRFVTPVILWNKKFICRSGTLTVRKSAVYETVTKPKEAREKGIPTGYLRRSVLTARNIVGVAAHRIVCVLQGSKQLLEMGSIERVREEDRDILESLDIKYICDLMVEDRKIVKQIRVGSSEKINRSIYADFYVEQIPYPGCEFFGRYRRAYRRPEGLIFNWNRHDVDAVLKLTKQDFKTPRLPWADYKQWDVVQLTQNYISLILTYLVKGQGGLLIHCISGWDRTPLFISLIRISLWADGVIHRSLSAIDLIYLTLAYDWYLFGHNLPTRIRKGEEIMHFCFKFLPYIADAKYSVRSINASKDSLNKLEEPERFRRLNFISQYVLRLYDQYIMPPLA